MIFFEQVRQKLKIKVSYGIDAAAGSVKETRGLTSLFRQIISRYPISYIEDPYPENSFKRFARLVKDYGQKVVIVGDDLTATNLQRIKLARQQKSINGIIIKPNQVGALTETLRVIHLAQQWGWRVIVSHRSGETTDDFIADLAWAVNADGVKFGAPKQKERLVKYRRLCQIKKEA